MAAHAQQTLCRLVKKSQESKILPKYGFVYGIHWSSTRVRILIHFPHLNKEANRWEFCQVVAAEHHNGYGLGDELSDTLRLYEDDMFLFRWRLVIALFTIRAHLEKLARWLAIPTRPQQAQTRHAVGPHSAGTQKFDSTELLNNTIWSEPFRVPKAWIVRSSTIRKSAANRS